MKSENKNSNTNMVQTKVINNSRNDKHLMKFIAEVEIDYLGGYSLQYSGEWTQDFGNQSRATWQVHQAMKLDWMVIRLSKNKGKEDIGVLSGSPEREEST